MKTIAERFSQMPKGVCKLAVSGIVPNPRAKPEKNGKTQVVLSWPIDLYGYGDMDMEALIDKFGGEYMGSGSSGDDHDIDLDFPTQVSAIAAIEAIRKIFPRIRVSRMRKSYD